MRKIRTEKKHWHRLVSVRFMYGGAIFFALLAAFLSYGGFLEKIDQMVSDTIYQTLSYKHSSSSIKMIAIDDETVEAFGEYKDWSRSQTAALLKILNKSSIRAPKVIGIDLDYSGEKDSEGDDKLTEVCSKYSNICLSASVVTEPVKHGEQPAKLPSGTAAPEISTSLPSSALPVAGESGQPLDDQRNNMLADSRITDVKMPYEALKEQVKTGIINNTKDSADGFVRNAIANVMVNGTEMDSFAVAVYKLYRDSQGREYSLPKLDNEQSFGFTYTKKSQDYTVYSFLDVVNGKVNSLAFKDSIVLVGDYTDQNATFKVPNQRNLQMQEIEVQANILEALLEQRTGQPASKAFMAVFYAIFIGLFYIATSYSSGSRTVIIAVALNVLQFGACLLLNRFGYYINILIPMILIVVVAVYNLFVRYIIAMQNQVAIEGVFKKYVDESVVDELRKSGMIEAHIGVERKDIAVMFVDIRGFTSLSESLKPEQIVEILNDYLTLAANAVSKYQGTLDKFIGDAAMAVFNAPLDLEDYEFRAVCAAWDLLSNAEELNQRCRQEYGKQVSFGIGIQCGEAVIGNIGCEMRMDYTAIGDTVNTASRLEGVAAPGQILISEEMKRRLGNRVKTSFAGEFALKGKQDKVPAYSVTGLEDDTVKTAQK